MNASINPTPSRHVAHVTIPDSGWEAGLGDDPKNALIATLSVNGLLMHLEAWEVHVDDEGLQTTVDPGNAEEFDKLHAAVHGAGAFSTLTIEGREYVVLATPYC